METMEKVQEAVSNADYTILIRENNRMTMAGFPTKVSESISCGTPVITTKTSDIDNYLPEGEGAYYIEIENIEESVEKIERLFRLNPSERAKQKAVCRDITVFEISSYIEPMERFLDAVLK